jgi:N-acetylmuramoyl-L-alanine amidase
MINYISSKNNNKLSAERPEGTKINTIVITYTASEGDINKAVTTMLASGSSVHYTIKADGFQDQHHSESQKAFFAGASHWHGKYGVNDYGIGIMLVNDAKSPFTDAQIDKLIATINDIQGRHNTSMDVVGLGEVNKNHIAPGVFFPWNKLAEAGIGKAVVLPNDIDITCKINLDDSGDKISELQHKLKEYGYQVEESGVYDQVTAKFAKNFANRYINTEDFDINSNFAESHVACWNDATELALNTVLGIDFNSTIYNTVVGVDTDPTAQDL